MAKGKTTASKALVPWDEKFAKYAKESKDRSKDIGAGGGLSVKFGPGTITVGGATLPGGKVQCIVLDWCFLNAWYKEKYDANDPQPPDCYAMGVDAKALVPSDESDDKQSEDCASCELNVFGSAENGRGKACGNNVRLALIVDKDAEDAGSVAMAEVAIARVSPTNMKSWAKYVETLEEEFGRPPWSVVTEISSHADSKTQIKLEFRLVDKLDDDEVLTALEKRYAKAQELLQKPYGPRTERPAPPPRGARKFATNGKRKK